MYCGLAFATLAVFAGCDLVLAEHIPSTTTAAELWNPWTWFWPYAKAAAEGYRDYYDKAQKATNELYQQIYKTNAFPWVTGNWGAPPSNNQGGDSGQSGQNNQGGQTNEGGSGGQTGQGDTTESNQGNTEDQEKETTAAQDNQTEAEQGTGAQVEGNVQSNGTAGGSANVDGEEVQV